MPAIQGNSADKGVPRVLEIEPRDDETYLCAHPVGNFKSKQEIIVPTSDLIDAVDRGHGLIEGRPPIKDGRKECEIQSHPEGLCFRIRPESRIGGWWVVVPLEEVQRLLELQPAIN